jgi:hypothetical protein
LKSNNHNSSYPNSPHITKDDDDDVIIMFEQAQAEEGPFPVDLKSMLIAEVVGTCLFVQTGNIRPNR